MAEVSNKVVRIGKRESRMVVAKRQGREIETKEEKTEQRKGRGPE